MASGSIASRTAICRRCFDAGENPPGGVAVRYFLPDKPEGDITLDFLDGDGKVIRTFTSKKEKKEAPVAEVASDDVQTGVDLGMEGREGERAQEAIEEEAEEEKQEPIVPKEVGLNRFVWDFRREPAHKVKGDTSLSFFLRRTDGPAGYVQRSSYGWRRTLDEGL